MKLTVVAVLLLFVLASLVSVWYLLDDTGLSGSFQPNDLTDDSVFVVDIRNAPDPLKLATTVSAGLLNSHLDRTAVFTLLAENDNKWAADIEQSSELSAEKWIRWTPADLVAYAIAIGAAKGTIVYNPAEPWSLANVVTLCGIQSAIPIPYQGLMASERQDESAASRKLLQTGQQESSRAQGWNNLWRRFRQSVQSWGVIRGPAGLADLPLLHDVTGTWSDELDAGLYAWRHIFPLCEDTDDTIATQRPRLLSQGYLADYVVSKKMFLYYLPEMCSDGPQKLLFRSFAQKGYSAGKQLKVMGYNTATEVVADCSIHHTEISLVSDWCPNLSFLSRMKGPPEPWAQNSFSPAPAFNPNHTYLAIVVSDGDNMQMENNGNRDGMEQRVAVCAQEGSLCPPLAWTISNQLLKFGPFQLQWYYQQARKTGRDSFLMGPSGFGFFHPSALEPESPILSSFVVKTVEAAEKLSMTSYVHWDVDGNDLSSAASFQSMPEEVVESRVTRHIASPGEEGLQSSRQTVNGSNSLQRAKYLKRYDGTQIDTIFAPGEYSIPKWSGNVAGIEEQIRWFTHMSPDYVAKAVSDLQRGTLGYIYKTFDVSQEALESVAAKVADHVKLVDHRQMHDIALQKKFYERPSGIRTT